MPVQFLFLQKKISQNLQINRQSKKCNVKSSIEKVQCQQKANPLFQATPIAQFNNDISEINSGTPINNGSPLFAFAMPQPILAFQTYETFDGIPTKGGPQYSWACVAACIAIMCGANQTNPLCVTNCLNSCVIN